VNPYTVVWADEATAELARIWLQAADRRAVTAAEASINRQLTRDPYQNGSLLSEDLYRLAVTPLVVTYTIDDAARRVEVSSVRYRP
jgi:mRNA-degrading endonuclease RelE of RelBE toxin-antitoxin system